MKYKAIKGSINTEKTINYLIIVLALYIIGIIIGTLIANSINSIQKESMYEYIDQYIHNCDVDYSLLSENSLFIKNFSNNIKPVIFIWILGLVTYGFILSGAIIALKGVAYGFTCSIFSMHHGYKGLMISVASYLPQNIILFSAYFLLASISIKSSLKAIINQSSKKKQSVFNRIAIEYLLLLIISVIVVLLGSIIETFITTKIIKLFV